MLMKSRLRHIAKTAFLVIFTMLIAPKEGWSAEPFVSFSSGDYQLNEGNKVTIYVDDNDQKGIRRAAMNLCDDLRKVCGGNISIGSDAESSILVGSIGNSSLIKQLIKEKKLDGNKLKGKHEMFLITTVGRQLVIAGSDRRGTIYGIYELSRQIGVSPWYYWADVPVARHEHIFIKKGDFTDGEPAVKYRGIFLNDEAPCLTSWVKNTFGTEYGDHRFYEKVFELILRLKGNFMWPAMWGWAFYADDPENSKTADEMGIIMGTSHHEPMARNHQEWVRHRSEYGAWNYQTNKQVIDRFFREGIYRMKGTEDIVTIGMRGDGDEAMSEDADTRLLKTIVDNQRRIIKEVTGKKPEKTPQVWALYKEVLDYYDKGMQVPDDVLMLLCDDNWGNLRRVPNARERQHPGGWGLYYHVDYVGAPRNTKWLNVTPTQNMWEQLQLAIGYGIDRMWILNVGDLKPMEYPITFFMDMAWNPHCVDAATIENHTRAFCREAFGAAQAEEAARLLNLCCKYNGRISAEMLDMNTYNLESGEWERVVNDYRQLETEALRQFITLPNDARDAYRELILFPIQAMGNVYEMYFAQAMNHALYKQNDPDATLWADKVEAAFRRDSLLCAAYNHEIAGGKWNGMMTQKHIGYTSWNDDFIADKMPTVFRITDKRENGNGGTVSGGYFFEESDGYIAMESAHFYEKQDAEGASWTEIKHLGRTLSGMALMPYTVDTKDATLTYRFSTSNNRNEISKVKVIVVTKSTLDFLNKGGLEFTVSIDGGKPVTVNFNSNLNEKPENIYSIYYPTVARRVVASIVELPISAAADGYHTLTIHPKDPGIVFEKIVVDYGGYKPSYLFMKESRKSRNAS